MKAAMEAAAIALLLILSRVESESGSTCSKDRKCPNSKTCCSDVCVAVRKVCKVKCREPADCNSSRSETCDNGFCKCLSRSSCSNDSIWDEFAMSKPCRVDADCFAGSGAQCLKTCENTSVIPTNDAKLEELPLNPALLAIVTIMGVLIFSFLFCCCLSRMKSERKSMKSREAKSKLKSLGIEPRTIGVDTENSSPLIKAESQGAASKHSTLAAENSKNTASCYTGDEEALSSVVVENGLPPIREEDEEDEEDKKD